MTSLASFLKENLCEFHTGPMILQLILLVCLVLPRTNGSSATVQTATGEVVGYSTVVPPGVAEDVLTLGKASSVNVFLGIPYAQPPIGQLRFARTVPVTPWKTLNASSFGSACHQNINVLKGFYKETIELNEFSEDCLYLNIFTPQFGNNATSKLPVMVWIHGGGYQYGSTNLRDGRVLATNGVVVVGINYRVGVMGYLSTDDDVAPGNLGMLDQIEALKWIQKNIEKFGGDPTKVTIFGQSSGGATVTMHMFSPLTKGLFHGVIAESGVATDTFAIYRPPYHLLDTTRSLAKEVGCTVNSTRDMVSCLRTKPAQLLAGTSISERPPMSAPWVPRVDGYYIKDLPENLLAKGQIHQLPLIAGSVTCETCSDYEFIKGIEKGLTKVQFEKEFRVFTTRFGVKATQMYEALVCQYYPRANDLKGNWKRLNEFMGYYEYIAGIYRMVDSYVKKNPNIWLYSYNYRSLVDNSPDFMQSYHSMELQYVFGQPFLEGFGRPYLTQFKKFNPESFNWTADDKQHSRQMMKIWSGFAKTLNPDSTGTSWPKYDLQQKTYLRLDKTNTIKHDQAPVELEFWNDFVPKVLAGTANPSDCPVRKHSGIIG
ncbi:hypothetical protein LOTGIDRAFT_235796 [Lottia gigantea]|uniref:Carboxylic ester hydrolase n=1 Tax=Lottia gigantea TaxID=225164 RepID=V3ZWE9_LOTGI|nr:hypothetical protein LOTGIDRAFT_235796 [Lottia gigantea]ESO85286.1 hypothetical protein LOTGIDRAFT_235796 [Lottia gigantea]